MNIICGFWNYNLQIQLQFDVNPLIQVLQYAYTLSNIIVSNADNSWQN